MSTSLEQNLLSLPNYALNSEVKDIQARVDIHISTALQYACKSWCNHLIEVRGDITTIIPALHGFLQERFLVWLEVLSVIGAARDAVIALEKLVPWLLEVCFYLSTMFHDTHVHSVFRWPKITSFSRLQGTIFSLLPPSLRLSMSLLPTFTTLLWNYPPNHQLFGSFTIIKDLIPHQEL
jgi:hypothetical protein